MKDFWLGPVPTNLRDQATRAIEHRNVVGFLISAGNEHGLELVAANIEFLKGCGLFEEALIEAWVSTRGNWSRYSVDSLIVLLLNADRKKILALTEPIPDGQFLTLYRGVSGRGRARRVCGLSWTSSIEKAIWFANRFKTLGDPGVYQARFNSNNIFAHINDRKEKEFIVIPWGIRPTRLKNLDLALEQ